MGKRRHFGRSLLDEEPILLFAFTREYIYAPKSARRLMKLVADFAEPAIPKSRAMSVSG